MSEAQPQLLISRRRIARTVRRLAAEISRSCGSADPLLVGILKGSFIFMADLVRQIDAAVEVDFIRLASYGSRTASSGEIVLLDEMHSIVQNRHVVVVEDIVDTGLTTNFMLNYLREKKPASLKLCALIDKPSRRKTDVRIDFLGFTIPDEFIVGYGIDWDEKYRNLPDICYIRRRE